MKINLWKYLSNERGQVDVIDSVARQDLADHETVGDPHQQYARRDGESSFPKIRLQSPDGNIWELVVNNNGILSATKL